MPGETPIETVSISTPLAAKNPFLVATIPGHMVAVGETWPKETLLADCAGAAAGVTASTTTGRATLKQRCIPRSFYPNSIDRPLCRPSYSKGQRLCVPAFAGATPERLPIGDFQLELYWRGHARSSPIAVSAFAQHDPCGHSSWEQCHARLRLAPSCRSRGCRHARAARRSRPAG